MKYVQGGVVAVVNGEKIYRDVLNKSIKNMTTTATSQGIDVSDPVIQAKILEQSYKMLIDNSVLTFAATKTGMTASEDEIKEKYDELATQLGGEETLKAQLAEAEMTPEELQTNIHDRILIDNYIESVTDIENLTVSDTEITDFLKQYAGEELPPLAEIKPQIEAQILNQKQQEIITGLIDTLRSEAKIVEKL